jgi:PAS domain-containing protein
VTLSALRLHRLVLLASLLVPALVFGAAAWWNRGEVLREGADTVQRTAAIMHEHAAKILDTADLVLDRVAERVDGMDAARLAAPETSAFLRRVRQPYEQFVSIWIADAEGTIRAGSQAWDPVRSIADREFFHVHRERPDAGTFVSAAFTGRATTMASFAVSRRRSDATGGFAGSIHVALSPDYFARFYAEAAPPFAHAAGLFRNDGAILARHPVLTDGHGRLGPGSPLLRHMAAGAERGVIGTPSSLDGQPRLYAFQKVGAWPVYVGFGADRAALLARWHGNLRAYGVVALAAALTLLLVAGLALRQARAAAAAEAALRREATARAAAEARQAAEARFRGVFESRGIGMAVYDLARCETILANDRLLEMTGGSRAAFEEGRWDCRRATAPEHLSRDERVIAEARARGWSDPYDTLSG